MTISGSELIVRALRQEGVEVLFGFPGGSVIPFFDALYQAPELRVVLTRHEQGAVHAADGYARSTGRVGVCVATSGPGRHQHRHRPGHGQLSTRVPLVCLTGQVPRHMIGNDAFQEADTVGHHPPGHQAQLPGDQTAQDLPRIIKEAFTLAASGRPGPGAGRHPQGRLHRAAGDGDYPRVGDHPRLQPGPAAATPARSARPPQALNGAQRPLFYVGGGVTSPAPPRRCAASRRRPACRPSASLMGIGALPGDRSAVPGHAGHARHLRGQHGRARLRPAVRRGRALRRPGHGRPGQVRPAAPASCTSTSTRRPSPERAGGASPSSATRAWCWRSCCRCCEPPASAPGWSSVAAWQAEHPLLPSTGGNGCSRRARHRVHRRGLPGGDRHHRGRPEPDVDRAVLQLHASRAPSSPPAGWAPWATASPRPSARSWAIPAGG